ncbi:hypothetical protein KKF84_10325 [Myxococcota bacterium]|nr:hypothetical protein [Myxococcota bacterium]MBU1535707.1 hypothetical protein [Myxococcota bacterium]
MNPLSYIKNRIIIIALAAALGLLLFFMGRQGPASPKSQPASKKLAEPPHITQVPPVKTAPVKNTVPLPNVTPKGCVVEKVKIPPQPVSRGTIPLWPKAALAPEDKDLEAHLKIAKIDKQPKFEQVKHYHIAGKIMLMRAKYLDYYANTGKKKPLTLPDGSDFAIPEERLKAKALAMDLASRAAALLSSTRPHPKYALWSEALYLSAQAYILVNKKEQAAKYLEIISRTKSKALAANYGRFLLGKLLFQGGKFLDAIKMLKKASELPPFFEKVREWYLLAARIGASSDADIPSLPEIVAPLAGNKEFYQALVFVIAERIKRSNDPLSSLKGILKKLPAAYHKPLVSWIHGLVKNSNLLQRTALATALCKMQKEM